MNLTALANMADYAPRMRSQLEQNWWNFGHIYINELANERVSVTLYEPVSFKLPGGSYTPDFLHITEKGQMFFVEIKGSKHQKGYRDARSKLRAAAELHPWFTFLEVRQENGDWTVERIKAA